ncbi:MAG: hypothetical protein HY975_02790, partial [Candidatus Kerfeldbacteria bacterium]|nr:hypothetical protein [Candidatus Kerfeldbacteria bacterium]
MPTLPLSPVKRSFPPLWRRLLLALVVLVVGAYLVVAVGVYGFQWRGTKTQRVAQYVPLPVAMV